MKKLLFICTLVALSFHTEADDKNAKKLKVELTEQQWDDQLGMLTKLQQYIYSTNLPHLEVINIYSNIDSLKGVLINQLQPQIIDSTQNKKK